MLVQASRLSALGRSLFGHRVAVQWRRSQMLLYSTQCRRGLIQGPNGTTVGANNNPVQRNSLYSLWQQTVLARSKSDKAGGPIAMASVSSSGESFEDSKFEDTITQALLGDQEIIQEPQRNRFGVLIALGVIVAGIYFGAWLAMIGAYVLEELDIFVDEDDDDD